VTAAHPAEAMPSLAWWLEGRSWLARHRPALARLASVLEFELDADEPGLRCEGSRVWVGPAAALSAPEVAQRAWWWAHLALHLALEDWPPPRRADLQAGHAHAEPRVRRLLAEAGVPPPRLPQGVLLDRFVWPEIEPVAGPSETLARSGGAADPEADGGAEADAAALDDAAQRAFWRGQRAAAARLAGEAESVLLPWLRRDREGGQGETPAWLRLLEFVRRHHPPVPQWSRPSRRQQPPWLLPGSLPAPPRLILAIDHSGSVNPVRWQQAWALADRLHRQSGADSVLLWCDQRLAEGAVQPVPSGQGLPGRPSPGGGGTDYRPVFDWAARFGAGRSLVYFTDGAGRLPGRPAVQPLCWVLPEGVQLPFGEQVAWSGFA